MKIVVCVKEVMDVTFPFVLNQETLKPLEEDVFYKLNPADACAAEVALTLKEQFGAEVCFLSFGPPRVEKTLRHCLGMGGDRAVRLWDERLFGGSLAKAYLLARAIRHLGADLVLCGSRSLDEGTGETPPALAEYLDIPQVTGVTDLEVAGDARKLTASRKLERGRRETIECPFPALLSVEAGMETPRYGELPHVLKACRASIDLLSTGDLEVESSEMGKLDALRRAVRCSLPRPRPKKTFNLESGLTAQQRMELMMSGGSRQGKSDFLEGLPEELAKKVAGILREKIFAHA